MPNIATITATSGIRFTARILRAGDRYGLDNCLTWDSLKPGVEFYDTRYPHTEFGQFTGARYYVETILERGPEDKSGLVLDGGIPDWRIDGPAMTIVRAWLRNEIGNTP